MGLDTASNSTEIQGAINGMFQAGGLIGTFVCSLAADRLGRKKAIFVAACICVVGGALQAGSVHIGMFIAARFITGLAIGECRDCSHGNNEADLASATGALVTLIPLFQSEMAPPSSRGLLVGLHGMFANLRCEQRIYTILTLDRSLHPPRIQLRQLDWSRVLLCQRWRCTVARTSGDSDAPPSSSCNGRALPPGISKMV